MPDNTEYPHILFENEDIFLKNILKKNEGIVLSVDVGLKKMGIASWQIRNSFAVPCFQFVRKNVRYDSTRIFSEIKKRNTIGLVIGRPTHGKINLKEVRQLSMSLAKRIEKKIIYASLDVKILLAEESMTTKIAENILSNIGVRGKKQEDFDDMISATILIQEIIDRKILRDSPKID